MRLLAKRGIFRPILIFCSTFILSMCLYKGTSAQQGEIRVAVLRSTVGKPAEFAERVDGALLKNLSDLAGIKAPTVSPIEYAEIRLTVGCHDESRSCLASIAKLVEVDAVLVRTLDTSVPGAVTLSLIYFDAASSDEPARVEIAGQGPEASKTVIDGVASAVRSLFGIPDAVTSAPAEEQKQEQPTARTTNIGPAAVEPVIGTQQREGIGALTWVTLAAGGASLAAGLVVGLSASDAYDDYKQTPITNESDIKRAEVKLDRAQSRGTLANVLIPAGGALLALGGVLLALDLSKSRHHEQPERQAGGVAFLPTYGGGLVMLDGAWRALW